MTHSSLVALVLFASSVWNMHSLSSVNRIITQQYLFHMILANHVHMQVGEVKSNLNQISFDIETIHQMVSGLVSCHYFLSSMLTWIAGNQTVSFTKFLYGFCCTCQEGQLELLESKQVFFSCTRLK